MSTVRHAIDQMHLLYEVRHYQDLPYMARELTDGDEILQARQLRAQAYVNRSSNAIDSDSLDEKGVLKDDPYHERSVYFGVFDENKPEKLLATARLIFPDTNEGIDSVPMRIGDLEEPFAEHLRGLGSSSVAELSSLVKQQETGSITTLFLIREMLYYSRANQVDSWVCNLNPKLQTKFERQFGSSLIRMGDHAKCATCDMEHLPYLVDTENAIEQLATTQRKGLGRYALSGMVAFMSDQGDMSRFKQNWTEESYPQAA